MKIAVKSVQFLLCASSRPTLIALYHYLRSFYRKMDTLWRIQRGTPPRCRLAAPNCARLISRRASSAHNELPLKSTALKSMFLHKMPPNIETKCGICL